MLDSRVCACLFTFARITQQPEIRVAQATFQVVDDISISFSGSSLSILGTSQRERNSGKFSISVNCEIFLRIVTYMELVNSELDLFPLDATP